MELKAKLSKPKEAAQAAQVAADTTEQKFYDLEMQETEARMIKELAAVCKEYCLKVWIEALNAVGALVDSEWRKIENIFYPEDLREAPEAAPEEAALALTATEQPPPTQALLPLPEATKRLDKTGDQGRGVEVAKGKEVG